MGSKAAIIDAGDGYTVLGHIEDADVCFQGGRGTVLGDAADHLECVLGRGRGFHLLFAAIRLDNCHVVSPHVFTYESAVDLDEDEAPPTFPDLIADEDTDGQ
jgi:hypothetical protein